MIVPVNTVEVKGKEVEINLAADQGNADWLRTRRLKKKKQAELLAAPMYTEIEDPQ